MKKGKVLSRISILAVLLIMSGSVFAQRGQRMQADRGRMAVNDVRPVRAMQRDGSRIDAVLDLSDEQKEAVQSLRATHQKEAIHQKNLLNEKNAQLKTLMSAPERDQKAVENTIDEISGMRGEMMKKQITNRDEMKNILSPEQVEKLESLGIGNGLRQGFQGKPGQNMRDGRRGNSGMNGRRGNSGMDSRRGNSGMNSKKGFQGKGFGNPVN